MAKIVNVLKNSVGEEIGIKIGDDLLGINGMPLEDNLQYEYYDNQQKLTLNIKTKDGNYIFYKVQKSISEFLGLEFDSSLDIVPVFSKAKSPIDYRDQLPKKLRKKIYDKLDDWRLSVLEKKYVTLSNLNKNEYARILRETPSPFYVDLVCVNNKIRNKVLGISKGRRIYKILKDFSKHGIEMYLKIILCPGVNDGEVLKKTLKKVGKLYPYVRNVIIVPVMLRKDAKVEGFKSLDKVSSTKVIDIVTKYNKSFENKNGQNFIFLSDEFYYKAKRVVPGISYYGDFSNLNNGIGIISKMRKEIYDYLRALKSNKELKKTVAVLTSETNYDFMCEVSNRVYNKFPKVKLKVFMIENSIFGSSAVMQGLYLGKNVISQIKHKNLQNVEKILVPQNMLKGVENRFLDDVSIRTIEKTFKIPTIKYTYSGEDFIKEILGEKI